MSTDTTKPSNEGSGKLKNSKELAIEEVDNEEIKKAFDINGYSDFEFTYANPEFLQEKENRDSQSGAGSSASDSSGSSYVKVDESQRSDLEAIIQGDYVQTVLKPQTEKTKAARKAKKSAKTRKDTVEKGEDLDK